MSASILVLLAALGCAEHSSSPSGALATAQSDTASLSGTPGDTSGDPEHAAEVAALTTLLEEAGYDVAPGELFFLDIEDCEHLQSCYGNNPASPYGMYALPVPEGVEPFDGFVFPGNPNSTMWRLRPDEAVLLLGRTPPPAEYFGLTSYVYSRDGKDIFASLNNSLNPVTLRVDSDGSYAGAFDQETAIVHTADANTWRDVLMALGGAGVSPDIVNLDPLPSELITMGGAPSDDVLGVLFRVALPEDPAALAAYREQPPVTILRITPHTEREHDPLPVSEIAERDTDASIEAPLEPALEALEDAAKEAWPSARRVNAPSTSAPVFGRTCIRLNHRCFGDNPDTSYALTPSLRSLGEGEAYLVLGVNHQATGTATYSNVSIYEPDKFIGVKNAASPDMPGTAQILLPEHPDADLLFAWWFARECPTEGPIADACTEVPVEFPGLGLDSHPVFLSRGYMEPGEPSGPKTSRLVLPVVLKIEDFGE
ncbi:MAG: hypothetical protein VX899_00035 [Myxococcota bacterium]|nr:hypothetical protein [Myxococcota bacterium]